MNTSLTKDIRQTHHWRSKLRPSILERDKFTCQSCGIITTALEVDHIDANACNNDKANLQSLCRPCHELKTLNENKRVDNYLDHVVDMKKAIYLQKLSNKS